MKQYLFTEEAQKNEQTNNDLTNASKNSASTEIFLKIKELREYYDTFLKRVDNILENFIRIKQEEINNEYTDFINKGREDSIKNVMEIQSKLLIKQSELTKKFEGTMEKLQRGEINVEEVDEEDVKEITEATRVLSDFGEKLYNDHRDQMVNIRDNGITALNNKNGCIQDTINNQQEMLRQFVEQLRVRWVEMSKESNDPNIDIFKRDLQNYTNDLQQLLGVDVDEY